MIERKPFSGTIEALDFALWEMEAETARRSAWDRIVRAAEGLDVPLASDALAPRGDDGQVLGGGW